MADETEGDDVCSEDKPASKVTEYLDDVVGTNVSSLSKVKVLLDDTLKKEKELKKRVSFFFLSFSNHSLVSFRKE